MVSPESAVFLKHLSLAGSVSELHDAEAAIFADIWSALWMQLKKEGPEAYAPGCVHAIFGYSFKDGI